MTKMILATGLMLIFSAMFLGDRAPAGPISPGVPRAVADEFAIRSAVTPIMRASLIAASFTLASAPRTAHSMRLCKNGQLYYSGSEFHAEKSKAEASAVEAWRRVKARTAGADRASRMFPRNGQLLCERAATKSGWRCFVRGGPCHQT